MLIVNVGSAMNTKVLVKVNSMVISVTTGFAPLDQGLVILATPDRFIWAPLLRER